jgi:nickel-dependent lactate racemase
VPVVELPWGAWYQDGQHRLKLPDSWSVEVLRPQDAPASTPEEIAKALASPIGSPSVQELGKGCKSACLVVDDLARPTRASDILRPLLGQLHEAGLPQGAIRIVVATGSHGSLGQRQLAWKVGAETISQYRVECHDSRDGLAPTGIRYGDRPLSVNRTFFEADLKIAVGSVLPHSFAGYSGGAKLVLPGLSDLEATARSHKFVQLGLRGGVDPNENRFRLEAEKLARRIGLAFVACVVTGGRRETVGVFAGDVVAAHRAACDFARQIYSTEVSAGCDCIFLNAYPKDVDLIQAENAFVALKTAKSPIVRDGGVIVLVTAASEGLGRHGLFEPSGVSYRKPAKKRALGQRELWIHAPSVSPDDIHRLYWEGYPAFRDADELAHALAKRFPGDAKAAVFPCAPMQQVRDLRDQGGSRQSAAGPQGASGCNR